MIEIERIDPVTGEVTRAPWYTITEIAEQMGVGPRQVRTVLRAMGFLERVDDRSLIKRRHVTAGLGKTLLNSNGQLFDIVSPAGLEYIKTRWNETVELMNSQAATDEGRLLVLEARQRYQEHLGDVREIGLEEAVRLVRSWYPDMSRNDIAAVTGFSSRTVYKYLR